MKKIVCLLTYVLWLSASHLSDCKFYLGRGNYGAALENCNNALVELEKSGEEWKNYTGHVDTTVMFNMRKVYDYMGKIYYGLKDFRKAIEFYNKELLILEFYIESEPPSQYLDNRLKRQKLGIAIIYNKLGVAHMYLGDNKKALNYFDKSLKIQEYYKEIKELAETYNNIGNMHILLGDYKKAIDYFNKSLDVISISAITHTISYDNMGFAYDKLGDYAKLKYDQIMNYRKAMEFYEKALSLRKSFLGDKATALIDYRISGDEHPLTARSYNNIGHLYYKLGDYEKAIEYNNKALVMLEKLGEKGLETATSYNNLGKIYASLSEYEKAIEFNKKALAISEKILGIGLLKTATSYNSMGLVYYHLKDYEKAYNYNLKAYNIYKMNRDKNFEFLSNEGKKNFIDTNQFWMVDLLSSSSKYFSTINNKAILNNELFDIWINDKGALLDSENALIMLKSLSKDENVLNLIEQLESYKREYAALSVKTPEQNEISIHQDKLKELDTQISNIEKELAEHSVTLQNALDIKDINTADVAKYLKDNELFIDFGYLDGKYYAFSVDNKGAVEFKALDEKDAGILDDKIKAFRDSVYKIIDNKESDITSSNENAKKELESIYKLVFEKALANRADSYDSLIISGDGMLRLLPFEALRFDDKYLIESKNIRYASSAKEFVRAHKFNNAENSSTLSVFSDPDYDKTGNEKAINIDDSASTRALGRAGVFTRLRGFKIEADAIQEQASGEVKMYSRADANEINLFAQKSPKILHIITHGIFINDENIINPMLKSGIALSGANTENKEGVVMALKLSGLSLKGTDMVVLSACETGVIDPKDTSAAAALPKTFIQAGAKNVMMSLWKVDDAHTVRLMKEFYADTSKGNYNELLRNSKLQMIKEGIHPYYWAGFIISGE